MRLRQELRLNPYRTHEGAIRKCYRNDSGKMGRARARWDLTSDLCSPAFLSNRTSLSSPVDGRGYRSHLPPHQPHVRSAVRELSRANDLESMPTVEGDVALPLGLKVGGKTIGVAMAPDRGQNCRRDSAALPVGMSAENLEVPVGLGWVHLCHLDQKP